MLSKIRQLIRRLFKSGTSNSGPEQPTPKNIANAPTKAPNYSPGMPMLPTRVETHKPFVSIILIIYKMPEQAEKTLYSLSSQYQRGVSEDDYEVIVIENSSSMPLGEQRATQYGSNFRYFYREENRPTPVPGVNFGAEQAKGSHIAVMIDGARMVTPGIVNYMLAGCRLSKNAVISVPSYHLGHKLQQEAMLEGYNTETEQALLESINWPKNGYRLFDIACLSGTCKGGFFKPVGESNCICVPRHIFDALGGFDENFVEIGGGQVNLDFYKRAVELEETELITLPGEGSFHQFHGGITTGRKGAERKTYMEDHFAEYTRLRGAPYQAPQKRSIYLGTIPDQSLKYVEWSAHRAIEVKNLKY